MIDLSLSGVPIDFDARGPVLTALLDDADAWPIVEAIFAQLAEFVGPADVTSRFSWLSMGRLFLRAIEPN